MANTSSYGNAQSRIWLEITERDDMGANLLAPQRAEGGSNRYRLVSEVEPGDTVLHYDRGTRTMVGISRAASAAVPDQIYWVARGTSARSKQLTASWRPANRVDLVGYSPLEEPVTRDMIVAQRDRIFALAEEFEREYGPGQGFPYFAYRGEELRHQQAYLTRYPDAVLALFPSLERQVRAFEARSDADLKPLGQLPPDPDLYVANEDVDVAHPGVVHIDPQAVERASREHARLQNALRAQVLHRGRQLVSLPGTNVDLAWAYRGGKTVVAEVKSLTLDNEEHQLRYGLGQLLDYLDEATAAGHTPLGVLFVTRPPRRMSWVRKLRNLDIELCWPGHWPASCD